MKEMKMELGRMEMRFSEEERKWRLSGLMRVGDLVQLCESEENLIVMI